MNQWFPFFNNSLEHRHSCLLKKNLRATYVVFLCSVIQSNFHWWELVLWIHIHDERKSLQEIWPTSREITAQSGSVCLWTSKSLISTCQILWKEAQLIRVNLSWSWYMIFVAAPVARSNQIRPWWARIRNPYLHLDSRDLEHRWQIGPIPQLESRSIHRHVQCNIPTT
jgi:hypothetical protein